MVTSDRELLTAAETVRLGVLDPQASGAAEKVKEPAQAITQVVGGNPQEQAHLVGLEAVTGASSGWRN